MASDPRQLLNDFEEVFRLGFQGQQVRLWTALPGIVTAVDLEENTCSVQPAIKAEILDEDGNSTLVNLPLLIHVPIIFPRAGGFALTLPIAAGDEVLVVFASRCIDTWWQQGGVQKASEFRLHDLSDGFAIPGPCSQPKKLASISATEAQLRNEAGTTYIAITPAGKIKLVSTGGTEITGGLKIGTVDFATHIHPGVTVGPGNTGVPIP